MDKNLVKLGNYIKIQTGKLDANASDDNGEYPFFTCAVEPLRINKYAYDCECILIAGNGDLNVKYYNGKFNAYQRTYIIEVINKNLEIRYLYHFLTKYIDILRKNSVGGVIKYIKLADLTDIKLFLPSINQQQKIVSILDKADEIRQKKKQANEKLDEFLKSTFIDMFGDPETNKKHWESGTIRDIIKEAKYGTSNKAGSEGKYPILRMGNLTYGGSIILDDLKYIDLKEDELGKYIVKKGDILFNRTNSKELVGKTAIYRSKEPMAFAGYLVRVRTNEKANAEFLSAFMNSIYMKKILRHKCKNIVGMANINAQELQDFGIYIPPIELQNKFAKIVEKVEAQKQKNEQVIKQMDNLFNALSQKAFKGELLSKKTNNVIDLQTKQLLLHTKIIDKCRTHQTFGSVKLEKLFNICDMTQDLNLMPSGYHRMAAGPYSPKMRYSVEDKLQKNKWIKITKTDNKVEYKKDTNLSEYYEMYDNAFEKEKDKISWILDKFYNKTTDYCEAFSTLYMCWNDLLIDGKNPKKSKIIDEFLNHWSKQKQRFNSVELKEILQDMENLHLVPKGHGIHTINSNFDEDKTQLSLL